MTSSFESADKKEQMNSLLHKWCTFCSSASLVDVPMSSTFGGRLLFNLAWRRLRRRHFRLPWQRKAEWIKLQWKCGPSTVNRSSNPCLLGQESGKVLLFIRVGSCWVTIATSFSHNTSSHFTKARRFLKMAGATRPKRRALKDWLLVLWSWKKEAVLRFFFELLTKEGIPQKDPPDGGPCPLSLPGSKKKNAHELCSVIWSHLNMYSSREKEGLWGCLTLI